MIADSQTRRDRWTTSLLFPSSPNPFFHQSPRPEARCESACFQASERVYPHLYAAVNLGSSFGHTRVDVAVRVLLGFTFFTADCDAVYIYPARIGRVST